MNQDVENVIRCYSVDNNYYMKEALKEAKKAYKKEEIPVGAILVIDDKIVARGHNKRELENSILSHAELNVIKKANKKLNSWRIENAKLYVTLEPCSMCMGAIIQSRISELYFGAYDQKGGACGSVLNLMDYKFNHNVKIQGGILEENCKKLLQDFFKELRNKKVE